MTGVWAAIGIQTTVFIALFLYLAAKLDGLGGRIDAMGATLAVRIDEMGARLDARIDETNARIDETNARIDETNIRIDALGTRLDAHVGGHRSAG